MGYTPKHAKPASSSSTALGSETAADRRRRALFAISEPSKGRHAADTRPGRDTMTPERTATTAV